MNIVLVVGLPASGKTFYAQERAAREGLSMVDDPNGLEGIFQAVMGDSIISDPHFCRPKVRKKVQEALEARFPEARLEWVFFENNLQGCLDNMVRRQAAGDIRKVEGMIRYSATCYMIPEGVKTLPVWSPK